jgi:hypothetical protein
MHTRFFSIPIVALVAVTGLLACSSSDGGSPGGAGGVGGGSSGSGGASGGGASSGGASGGGASSGGASSGGASGGGASSGGASGGGASGGGGQGQAKVGDPCTADAQCPAFDVLEPLCMKTWPGGGSCTSSGCQSDLQCADGAHCAPYMGQRLCLVYCDQFVKCRPGYTCTVDAACVPQ